MILFNDTGRNKQVFFKNMRAETIIRMGSRQNIAAPVLF